jgi:hypothetical protein
MNDGDLGFAVVDHDRPRRCGFPEVVLCAGKQSEQVVAIAREVFARSRRVLLTRCDAAQAAAVQVALPAARHHERARCLTIDPEPLPKVGRAAIVVAGTSDLPVAEEARVTLDVMGIGHELFADVGVAGLHRLLARIDAIRSADVVLCVAGMDGALPSVVAGLVDRAVIAVPTSVGYGASFDGLAALLTMMNACAAGVAVVNIDNGFGAGYLAARILRAQ